MFEKTLAKIEEIAKKLEDKALPLEQAIDMIAEGKDLAKTCYELIAQASGKLALLSEQFGELIEQGLNLAD